MNKELIFVHDWIGPKGPINNHKTPNLYDFAKRALNSNIDRNTATDEHDPIVTDINTFIKCKVVPSYELESLNGAPFLYEIVLTPRRDYHRGTLADETGFLDGTPIPSQVYEAIKNKQGYFLLTTRFESFLEDEVFLRIHRYFTDRGIPLSQIIYLTNCANSEEIYKKFCIRYNIQEKINCEYVGLYLLFQKTILKYDSYYEDRDESKNKEKIFLNFNRRHKLHRYLILLKFMEKGILNHTYMSFSKDHDLPTWEYITGKICHDYHINLSHGHRQRLHSKLPMVLDSDNFYRYPVEDDLKDTATWYDKTYINLASETNFENDIIHMTEKTIKPIMFKQPFIIIGPPKTLMYLKYMGFKTFSDYWDESYDNEIDHKTRMNMIVNVCTEITKWPQEQLLKLYKRTKEIREHNFQTLKNLEPKELINFINKYGAPK